VKQNVTLSLPAETVRRLKVLAAERGSSISRMLTQQLEEILRRDDEYERARQRILADIARGWDLGTEGRISWRRDELHER
jgi:predicted transcriptional regulator